MSEDGELYSIFKIRNLWIIQPQALHLNLLKSAGTLPELGIFSTSK